MSLRFLNMSCPCSDPCFVSCASVLPLRYSFEDDDEELDLLEEAKSTEVSGQPKKRTISLGKTGKNYCYWCHDSKLLFICLKKQNILANEVYFCHFFLYGFKLYPEGIRRTRLGERHWKPRRPGFVASAFVHFRLCICILLLKNSCVQLAVYYGIIHLEFGCTFPHN